MIEIKVLASSSRGNCYHITDGSTQLLLECGISFKEIHKGIDFKISDIAGCLVSHEHKDHCKAIREVMKTGIDCYMSKGTMDAIGCDGHRAIAVEPKKQFRIGTWTILPFDTQHDAAEPLGFLLANRDGDKLLFATDTYYIKYKFEGLTHIMVECNYASDILGGNVEAGRVPEVMKNRLLKSHFSLANVKEFFRSNNLDKVQEIWLIHLSDGNSDAVRFKREIMELTGKVVYIANQ
ncbi:Phosphoribosyl 1,2-cyclic phosphodiesterase [Geosporobacter subterraneus DSM 17957]|uniref:Phosphoribosyl 1,2-cyclic phosphodiesterase n=1 Tax=Geosporobacter subterraneus DSM 17957 TaxID=1121919 RepID=A0A1M6DSH9_9FIRM|nr:MBL fold metallo-hydrolase [Geosporobacter subterraneus]SHI76135.1 Phosphoribosyl 1,2-cyclic phosphodiesterase [Geosporobacter subterraneus DSM 17957]